MIQLLGAFFIFSLTGALSPGPLTTMAIAEGSRRGRWSGWWLSLGHGIIEGLYVLIIAIILWLGRETLLQQPLVTGVIALVGGGFLIWMGWRMALAAWRRKLTLQGEAGQEIRLGLVPMGAFLSISNPYWWLWWALIASAFVGRSLAWGLGGVVILFVVHWLTDFGWLTGLSWLTGSGRSLISPGLYRWVLVACGIALIFFGLSFIGLGVEVLRTGDVNIL
jgi:threonine/homoserine/homoserine lactone efflux protein